MNLIQEDKKNSSSSEDSEFVSKLKPVDEANQDLDIKNVEYGTVAEQIPETVTLRENEVGQMNWIVQIGSFSNKENAEKLNLKAKSAGFRSFINPIMQNNRIMHQVCLGPAYDAVDAHKLLE